MDQHDTTFRKGGDISSAILCAFRRSVHKSGAVVLIWHGGLPLSCTNTSKSLEDHLSVSCIRDTSIALAVVSLHSVVVAVLELSPRSWPIF